MTVGDRLTVEKIRRVKEIFERNAMFREPHCAWVTAEQWKALGGRPDLWDMLPEVAPGLREMRSR